MDLQPAQEDENSADQYRVGGPGLAFETWVSPREWILDREHSGRGD
jgi:hypothetical protein